MVRRSWRQWFKSFFSRPASRSKPGHTRSKLYLEALEDRLAPAQFTWSGAGGNALWSNPSNWVGGVAPTGTASNPADLFFADTVNGNTVTNKTSQDDIVQANNFDINSITFQGSNFTLSKTAGAAPIILNGIVQANTNTTNNTIGFNFRLASGGLGDFNIGSTGGGTLTQTVLTVSGQISGDTTTALLQEGTGTLVLSADNSGFDGPVTISAGAIQIQNSNALGNPNVINPLTGSPSAVTTVQSSTPGGFGGQLELSSNPTTGQAITVSERLLLSGQGDGSGALLNVAGNNVLTPFLSATTGKPITDSQNLPFDVVTLESASTIATAKGTSLTINEGINELGGSQALIFGSLGTSVTNGTTTSAIVGNGTVVLDPLYTNDALPFNGTNSGNLYSGGTTVINGNLAIANPNALGLGPATVGLNNNEIGTLQVQFPTPNPGGVSADPGHPWLYSPAAVVLTGTLAVGSPVVTGLSSTSGLSAGMLVTGNGIRANTFIESVDSASQVTLSNDASVKGSSSLSFTRPFTTLTPSGQTGDFSSGSAVVQNLPSTAGLLPGMLVTVTGVVPVRLTGDLSSGSSVVQNLSSTSNLSAGMLVTGTGIPANTFIRSVDSATQVTLTNNASVTQTGASLSFFTSYLPHNTYIQSVDSATQITLSNNATADGTSVALAFNNAPLLDYTASGVADGLKVYTPLTLNGHGFGGAGALDNLTGNNYWENQVTYWSDATSVNLGGAIAINVAGSTNLTLDNLVSDVALGTFQEPGILTGPPRPGRPGSPVVSFPTGFGTVGLNVGFPVSGIGIPPGTTILGLASSGFLALNVGMPTPSTTNTITGTITPGSPVVTLASTAGLGVGMQVTGTGIPGNTFILSVDSGTQVTLTRNATLNRTESITFTAQITLTKNATLSGTETLTFSQSLLSNSYSFNKIGAGTLTLTDRFVAGTGSGNTFVGATNVQAGTLAITDSEALGTIGTLSASSPVTVFSVTSATLELETDQYADSVVGFDDSPITLPNLLNTDLLTPATKSLSIFSNGVTSPTTGLPVGALYNADGSNEWQGPVSVFANAAIGVDASFNPFDPNLTTASAVLTGTLAGGSQTGTLTSGSPLVSLSSTVGLSAGMSVTGTGIPAGTTILTVNTPNSTLAVLTGTVSNGSNMVTGLSSTTGLSVGMLVTDADDDIPADTFITAVDSVNKTVTLSNSATVAGGGSVTESLTFTPVITLSANATTTGSTTLSFFSDVVTGLPSTGGLSVGMLVTGNGIPANTYIVSVDSATQVTLSNFATASGQIALSFIQPDTSLVYNDRNQLTLNSGQLTGGTLTKIGMGELVLPVDNPNYGSNIEIKNGWISIESPQALAGIGANTTDTRRPTTKVDSGAALVVKPTAATGNLILFENLILAGLGLTSANVSQTAFTPTGNALTSPFAWLIGGSGTGNGALLNLSGNNFIRGAEVFLASANVGIGVEQDGGLGPNPVADTALPVSQLTLTGEILNANVGLNGFASSTNVAASGITKLGSQALFLQGPGNYSGNDAVNAGVLVLQNSTGLGYNNATFTATGQTTTVLAGAALELGGYVNDVNATPTLSTIENGGLQGGLQILGETLVLQGNSGYTPRTNGNAFHSGGGTIVSLTNLSTYDNMWNGPVLLQSSAANTLFPIDVQLGSRLSVFGAIDDGSASPGTNPAAGIVLNDTGELVLGANNSYRGDTVINKGIIVVDGPSGNLGQAGSNVNVASGASLELQGNITISGKTLNVQGTGLAPVVLTGTLLGGSQTGTLNGTTVTGLTSTAGLLVGMSVTDTTTPGNIPPGTTIASIVSPTSITLSAAATSGTDTLTFLSNVVSLPSTIGLSVGAGVTGAGIPANTTIQSVNSPNSTSAVLRGNLTSGSAVVMGLSSTAGLSAGMLVTGIGIPGNTFIQSVDSATQVTLTNAATATVLSASLSFASLITLSNYATATGPTSLSFAVPVLSTQAQQWLAQGPAPIVTTAPAQQFTGRITGVAVDPQDVNVIYISAAGGGIWKTIDGGQTWHPLLDSALNTLVTGPNGTPLSTQNMFFGTLTIDPNNPNLIFAATGEDNNSLDSFAGDGILESTNGGKTWIFLPTPTTSPAGGFNDRTISKMVYDPARLQSIFAPSGGPLIPNGHNDDFLYVAVSGDGAATNSVSGSGGIWRFDLTTRMWTNLTANASGSQGNKAGLGAGFFKTTYDYTDLAVVEDPFGFRMIVFAVNRGGGVGAFTNGTTSAEVNGVWEGLDETQVDLTGNTGTITQLVPDPPVNPPANTAAGDVNLSLTVQPGGGGTDAVPSPPNPTAQFSHSGEARIAVSSPVFANNGTESTETYTIYALVAYPSNYSSIAGVGNVSGNAALNNTFRDIEETTITYVLFNNSPPPNTNTRQAGQWTVVANNPPSNPINSGAAAPTSVEALYNEALLVDPNNLNNLFAGGVNPFDSTTGGTTWNSISTAANGNAPHTNYHALAFDGPNVLAATDGGLFKFNTTTGTWSDLTANLGVSEFTSVAVAPSSPLIALGSSQANGLEMTSVTGPSTAWQAVPGAVSGNGGTIALDTTSNPQLWRIYYEATPTPGQRDNAAVIGGYELYTATYNTVTNVWSAFTPLVGVGGSPTPVVIDSTTPSDIAVGVGGSVEISRNNGTSFLINLAPGVGTVTGIGLPVQQGPFVFDPRFPLVGDQGANQNVGLANATGTIYVLGTSGVAVTKNGGATFAPANGNAALGTALPTGAGTVLSAIAVDPRNENVAYLVASTPNVSKRVFVTYDAGQNWYDITGDMQGTPTTLTGTLGSMQTGTLTTGSPLVSLPTTVGLSAGVAVTGTGIPAGTTIQTVNTPNSTQVTLNGNVTNASAVVTNLATTSGLIPGMLVTDTAGDIPAGTTILSVNSATQVTLSANATGTAFGDSLTFSPLITLSNFATTTGPSTLTFLNNVVTVSSTAGLSAGMTVTGTGIPPGTTILAVNTPNSTQVTTTGNVANGSAVVTNLATTSGLSAGMLVTDTAGDIPAGTTILSVNGPTQVTLSNSATATMFGDTLTFSPLITLSNNVTATGTQSLTFTPTGLPVYSVAVDSRTGDLYAGTSNGVYELQGGPFASPLSILTPPTALKATLHWQSVGIGLPGAQVNNLVLNQVGNTLTAGTYGRGLFTLFLDSSQTNDGAVRATAGSSFLLGPVNMTGNTTIDVDGSQTLQSGPAAHATLTIQGTISDAGAASPSNLTKIGQGNLVLKGSNTYFGFTDIQAGVVVAGNNNGNALSSNSIGATVEDGAQLQVQSNLQNTPLYLFGNGININNHFTGAVLDQTAGTFTISDPVHLMTPSVTIGVSSSSATLILSGVIDDSTTDTALGVPGGVTPAAKAALIKELAGGVLVLTNANRYRGDTFVNQGILRIQNNTALGLENTTQTTTVVNTAQLQVTGGITVGGGALTPESLVLSGTGNQGTGALQGFSLNPGTPQTNTWLGSISLQSVQGNLPAPIPPTSVAIGVVQPTDTLIIRGAISDTGTGFGLTKVGQGAVILTQNDSYTGQTLVSAGILNIQAPTALGTGTTTVASGATLQLQGASGINPFSAGPIILNGTGVNGNGALENVAGNNTLNSTITLQTAASIGVDGPATTILTLPNTITGTDPNNLTKVGPGILDITADNSTTLTGTTVGSGGTLQVDGTIGPVSMRAGTLAGIGTVGAVNSTGTSASPVTVAPGDNIAGPPANFNFSPLTSGTETWTPSTIFSVNFQDQSNFDKLLLGPGGVLNINGATLTGQSGTFIFPYEVAATLMGTLTSGSPGVTVSSTSGLGAGMAVTGTGIPPGTTILVVNSSTQFTLSNNATVSGNESLTLTPAQYTIIQTPNPTGISPSSRFSNPNNIVFLGGQKFSINYTSTSVYLVRLQQTNITSVTVTPSAGPYFFGQPITFSIVVTKPSTAPAFAAGDTVTFTLDGTQTTLPLTISGNTATASFTTSSSSPLAVGSHSFSAFFNGDTNLSPMASTPPGQTLTVSPNSSTTTVVPSASTSIAGQPLNFTVNVTASHGGSIPNGGGTVTLTVQPPSGPSTTLGGSGVPVNNGSASFSAPGTLFTQTGSYTITGNFTSTTTGVSSSMGTWTQTVVANTATAPTLAFSSTSLSVAQGGTFSDLVVVHNPGNSTTIPSNFTGTATLTIKSGPAGAGTVLGTVNTTNGQFNFTNLTFNTPGTYTVQVSEVGLVSTPTQTITVSPPVLAFTSVPSPVLAGSSFTVMAGLTSNGNAQSNSSVTLKVFSGTSATGTPVQTVSGTTNSSGVATFNVAPLTAGTYTLQATAANGAVVSTTTPQISVQNPTLAAPVLSASSVMTGQGFTVGVKVMFNGSVAMNFNGRIQLTVASGPSNGSPYFPVTVVLTSASNGVAVYGSRQLNTFGNYTFQATVLNPDGSSTGIVSPQSATLQVLNSDGATHFVYSATNAGNGYVNLHASAARADGSLASMFGTQGSNGTFSAPAMITVSTSTGGTIWFSNGGAAGNGSSFGSTVNNGSVYLPSFTASVTGYYTFTITSGNLSIPVTLFLRAFSSGGGII